MASKDPFSTLPTRTQMDLIRSQIEALQKGFQKLADEEKAKSIKKDNEKTTKGKK